MIDRMSGRIALVVVAAAVLAIMLLGWFVLVSPERSKATQLDGQIADTSSQLAQVTALLNGPIAKQSKEELAVSKVAVPEDPDVPQVLRQLSVIATDAGVELDGITPQPAVAAAAGQAIPFGITVKGQYFALKKFFTLLRTRAVLVGDKLVAKGRLYTVDNISFSGGGQATDAAGNPTGGGSLVSATITITAYAFAPVPGATTETTPSTSDNTTVTPPPVTSP